MMGEIVNENRGGYKYFMGNDLYRKLGASFLISAGVIYAIERVGSLIARSHETVALYEANMFETLPETHITGFFDNIFVPILTFLGMILFVYGFPKKIK
jgi:hypothetical protein